MTASVPDLRGDLVTVGDTIAYAATDGRTSGLSSGLRVGEVTKITETKAKRNWQKDTFWLVVCPTYSSSVSDNRSCTLDASLKRFVKVND